MKRAQSSERHCKQAKLEERRAILKDKAEIRDAKHTGFGDDCFFCFAPCCGCGCGSGCDCVLCGCDSCCGFGFGCGGRGVCSSQQRQYLRTRCMHEKRCMMEKKNTLKNMMTIRTGCASAIECGCDDV